MKQINKILSITLCGALLLSNMPVKADAASKPFVTKKMTLVAGSSKTIKVKCSSIKKKTFKSNNRKVAVVNKKGKVTAKQRGVCKVTVKVKYKKGKKYVTKKYTCTVTVNRKYLVAPTTNPTETPQVSAPNGNVIPSIAPVVSNEPSAPSIEVTPSPDASMDHGETPEASSSPDTTQEPDITPTVSNEPVKETQEPSTPDVEETPSPTNSTIPDITQEPTVTPSATNEPIKETPSPTGSTDPSEVPGVPGSPDTTQEPEITPTVSNEPTGETKEPSVPDETNPPVNTPSVEPEEPDVPVVTPPVEEEECEHEIGDTWSVVYNRILTPICKNCNEEMGSKYQISFRYKGEQYTYTKWNPEPSETTEGILDVYQGVNIYDMTEEELEQKYEKFNVVFSDGRTDTFYGKWINNVGEPTDDRDEAIHFGVYAKSTAEKIGSITYPKYEVKTIDLGNGETTKVYGYYDREMADEVFRLLNEYRVENGLNELETSDFMQNVSDTRSSEAFYTEMYNQQNTDYEYGGHERPNKTAFYTALRGVVYTRAGENLIIHTLIEDYQAGGLLQKIEITPENIMQSFKDSEEHNANMLRPEFEGLAVSVFIGYPQNKDGTFRSYKVAVPVQSFVY